MSNGWAGSRRWYKTLASYSLGGVFILSFLGDCDNSLVQLTRFVEPCGTVFANCQPGDIQVNAADVGDFCVDPACSVPGGCGNLEQPLGTITDICP